MNRALSLLMVTFTVSSAFAQDTSRWLDPRCTPLEISKNGPFIQEADGTLLAVFEKKLQRSTDGGKTWAVASPEIAPGVNLEHVGHVGQIMRTTSGTIVVTYLNFDGYKFEWDDEKNEPKPTCKLELRAIRSTDNGKTWVDEQLLLPGYNADYMGFIQTKSGRIVVAAEHLDHELKRWVVCSIVSDDDGKTWRRGNWIDLGGRGHHDGAVEPMVVELNSGKLMMLIRTNLDQFWRAYSDDGLYWRTIEPSGIDASSAPGWLLRLKSGNLALVWNRLNSERKGVWEKSGGASTAETPASWHREELSMAFSSDDGKTWSKPTVVAHQDGGQFAYPYLMERAPGELWVFTRYTYDAASKPAPYLAFSVKESDFIIE